MAPLRPRPHSSQGRPPPLSLEADSSRVMCSASRPRLAPPRRSQALSSEVLQLPLDQCLAAASPHLVSRHHRLWSSRQRLEELVSRKPPPSGRPPRSANKVSLEDSSPFLAAKEPAATRRRPHSPFLVAPQRHLEVQEHLLSPNRDHRYLEAPPHLPRLVQIPQEAFSQAQHSRTPLSRRHCLEDRRQCSGPLQLHRRHLSLALLRQLLRPAALSPIRLVSLLNQVPATSLEPAPLLLAVATSLPPRRHRLRLHCLPSRALRDLLVPRRPAPLLPHKQQRQRMPSRVLLLAIPHRLFLVAYLAVNKDSQLRQLPIHLELVSQLPLLSSRVHSEHRASQHHPSCSPSRTRLLLAAATFSGSPPTPVETSSAKLWLRGLTPALTPLMTSSQKRNWLPSWPRSSSWAKCRRDRRARSWCR